MNNKQSLSIEQRLGLKMSPKQMQLMRLLQVPSVELLTSIREEMEVNPALEEAEEEHDNADDTDNINESNEDNKDDILEDYFNEDESDSYKERSVQQEEKYKRPAVEQASFHEQVSQQFRLLQTDNLQQIIGEIIIGNLDDDGYLTRSVAAIVNDLAFLQNISVSQNQVEDVLKIIQTLDPSGIGARSLRECLQIQLQRSEVEDASILAIAQKIVSNNTRFDEFTLRKYDLLIKRFKISAEDFKDAISLITRLNPKPGGGAETNTRTLNPVVIPDFSVYVFGNEITVSLNNDYVPDLRVNPAYQQMLNEYSPELKSDKTAVSFIKQKIENARSFINLIKERQNTLLNVMRTIVNLQKNYFLTGERSQLKPMVLKDVAEITKLDISTVSRITSNKYAQTPYGIILLKDFFSQALQNEEGDDVSSIEVKDALKKIITDENPQKPFTDEALVVEMRKNGYMISRRTITKYRELFGIPVARLRRGM